MLQYYTLEQAAKLLDVSPEKAKKVLDDKKVRQYRDGRGAVRYVASAVDELARAMGRGSDAELQLGEAAKGKSGNSPRPSKIAKPEDSSSGSFDFDLPLEDSAEVAIGREKLDQSASASKKTPGGSPKSPRSPAPKAGSDSDVRLVTDGSDLEFQISVDSDVRMVDEAGPASSKSGKGKSKPGTSDSSGDSDVRIVGMEVTSDPDVHLADSQESNVNLDRPPVKKHSDSDIRLEGVGGAGPGDDEGSDDALVTEEIDLDAEERKAREAQPKKKGKSKMKKKTDAAPPLPTSSPFELSEDDLELPKGGKKKPDSSDDFDLTPAALESDDEIELSSGDMPALKDDSSAEEVALGDLSSSAGAETSGINLDAPIDSGISLEGTGGSGDEMEFELSLDAGSTPKPGSKSGKGKGKASGKSKAAKAPEPEDSDSEFELTLDSDSSGEQPVPQSAGEAAEDSDSEFELTLDDSGGLVPMEGEQAAASGEAKSQESDIFETDFEVPALDEESGSEAVALDDGDTDLESSDFDLALEEGDAASDEESGSQVVALEDEAEVDEAAETVQRPRKKKKKKPAPAAADDEASAEEPLEELADVDDEEAVAEEEDEEAPARAGPTVTIAAAPAPWGALPAVVMLPCVVVMLLAGLMGYELIRTSTGYQQPGKVTGWMAEGLKRSFDLGLPKE